MRRDPDRFYMPSPGPKAGDSRDERDLQRADYLAVLRGNRQMLVRIRLYGLESGDIPLIQRCTDNFALAPERVIGQQRYDCGDIR